VVIYHKPATISERIAAAPANNHSSQEQNAAHQQWHGGYKGICAIQEEYSDPEAGKSFNLTYCASLIMYSLFN
jgi:hypothetical protein